MNETRSIEMERQKDSAILEDYKQFRKVRARVVPSISPKQWSKMNKRTKAALVDLVEVTEKAIARGKL